MNDESRSADGGPASQPSEFNAIAWAWSPRFLVVALVVLVIWVTLVTWLVPEGIRLIFYPVGVVIVYGIAHWFNRAGRGGQVEFAQGDSPGPSQGESGGTS
ncbi:hypothetical protein JHN63_07815 [Streptomyces sp. MBT65]|uniref:hypothetical protein n=1 Tax=Streptomyces sp. MBT65 TaxID=1488395 RepID=UPI00190E0CCD|nr:hypothetical protein [Streptomyces sp. MBT65]MBK3573724.1 hypothetical protein [Streptomyces sp. MBT65]